MRKVRRVSGGVKRLGCGEVTQGEAGGTCQFRLTKDGPYDHNVVNHRAKEYARGKYHVNSLEGFWGHFKKGLRGTNVHVSAKHMWKYVAEFTYRYNTRAEGPEAMFKRLVGAFSLPRLQET